MARPLIRRRIMVTGRQRTDIDADLLIQALIQIAEDEATQTSPDTHPAVRTRASTRPNSNRPTAARKRPTTSTTAPSPSRPASRTGRAPAAARDATGRRREQQA
jgi:hypothetical protein